MTQLDQASERNAQISVQARELSERLRAQTNVLNQVQRSTSKLINGNDTSHSEMNEEKAA
jgi:hypothetical protein